MAGLTGGLLLLPTAGNAATWDGGAGAFGASANWDGDVVPSGTGATISNGGQALVAEGNVFSVTTLGVGGHAGSGTITQSGGFLAATQVMIGGDDSGGGSGAGTYAINGGTLSNGPTDFWVGSKGGSGTLNIGGTGYVTSAASVVIGRDGAAGQVNLSGNAILEMTNGGGNISLGVNSPGFASTMTVGGVATVSSANELYVGWFANGTNKATLEVGASATITVANGLVVGRDNGTGTMNVSGSAVLEIGGGLMAGAGSAGSGTVTIGGNATVTAAWFAVPLSDNASGVFTINGGNLTAVANTGELQGMVVHASGAGTMRQVNLNGGTLSVNGFRKRGGNLAVDVNFNGGTIRATLDNANFFSGVGSSSGFTSSDLEIQAGGLIFDTNGHAVTITQSLGGAGGLTKLGPGVLTLSSGGSYAGDTVIGEGTLSITTGFLADDSDILLFAGAGLDLKFSGVDAVHSLFLDGDLQPVGTWGAIGSGADFESTLFTGTGVLNVVVGVPEPAAIGLLLTGGAGLLLRGCRRRN